MVEESGKVTRIDATIDVKDIPTHLHQFILLMIRTNKLSIPSDVRYKRCAEVEPEEKVPWWKIW
jgi:hypothetical protein